MLLTLRQYSQMPTPSFTEGYTKRGEETSRCEVVFTLISSTMQDTPKLIEGMTFSLRLIPLFPDTRNGYAQRRQRQSKVPYFQRMIKA